MGSSARSRSEKRKELLQLLFVWLAAILADLEGFGVLDLFRALSPVELAERRARSIGGCGEYARPLVADCFLASRHCGRVSGVRDQVGPSVATAFIEL